MELEFLPCPTCREVTLVEIPPCPDAHGDDCPDRACTQCGTALALDVFLLGTTVARRAGSRPNSSRPNSSRPRSGSHRAARAVA